MLHVLILMLMFVDIMLNFGKRDREKLTKPPEVRFYFTAFHVYKERQDCQRVARSTMIGLIVQCMRCNIQIGVHDFM